MWSPNLRRYECKYAEFHSEVEDLGLGLGVAVLGPGDKGLGVEASSPCLRQHPKQNPSV